MKADIIVVGAGPAGMMAAYAAADQGASVLLLEKNDKTGKKLRISGKGRCNLTNNSDVREVLANIPGDGRFLYSALTAFPPERVMAFFEEHGLPLKTERGKRVFPQSDRANDVANLMQKLCRESGVTILQKEAKGISLREGTVLSADGVNRGRISLRKGGRTHSNAASTVAGPAGESGSLLHETAGAFPEKCGASCV